MTDQPDPEPQQPSEPAPPDPNTSPFESPSFEKVEKGISGPWERNDDD